MGSTNPSQRHHPRFEDSIGLSPSFAGYNYNIPKKKWSNLTPVVVVLVVVAEIAFLGRLDMAKKADLVNSWADSFYQFTASSWLPASAHLQVDDFVAGSFDREPEDTCENWLEKEDVVTYSRDFEKEPIFVSGAEQEWKSCSVGCKFGFDGHKKPDAAFGLPQQDGTASVIRSMESSQYYAENDIALARRWVSTI